MKRKHVFFKIHSIRFGGLWIGTGLVIGIVIPLLIYFAFHVYYWMLSAIGGGILLAFGIVFAIEMHQDFSKKPYYKRRLAQEIPFDEAKQYAVIRCSICTGEQVAGFKNKEDGTFVEVMVIRSPGDLEFFQKTYQIETIKKEY